MVVTRARVFGFPKSPNYDRYVAPAWDSSIFARFVHSVCVVSVACKPRLNWKLPSTSPNAL